MIKAITMKTAITAIATLLLMTTTAVAEQSCTVKTDTSGNQIKQGKCDLLKGVTGAKGDQGIQGKQGSPGKDGTNGKDGATGPRGLDGTNGTNGKDGSNGQNGAKGDTGDAGLNGTAGVSGTNGNDGKDAIAPLGSLSFAAASASFYGDGIGFGLSNSNYGSLEGSIVMGFDLDYNWRIVGGLTTDFNGRTAVSVGLGYSF